MKKSEGPDLKKQIFVIGAGASGLMAAIQAAVYGAAVPAKKSVLRETAVVI